MKTGTKVRRNKKAVKVARQSLSLTEAEPTPSWILAEGTIIDTPAHAQTGYVWVCWTGAVTRLGHPIRIDYLEEA
jgi:hypothetical protein